MTERLTDRFWKAEARTEQAKQLIRGIKRITLHKFTPEDKIRIAKKPTVLLVNSASRQNILTWCKLGCKRFCESSKIGRCPKHRKEPQMTVYKALRR